MRCYFIRKGRIIAVEPIPGLTDEQAIEKGHALFKERKHLVDGFEIWDLARMVVQHPPIVVELSQLRNGLARQAEQENDPPRSASRAFQPAFKHRGNRSPRVQRRATTRCGRW
jgi:hypothetical protein